MILPEGLTARPLSADDAVAAAALLAAAEQVDDQLLEWLAEAYDTNTD